MSLVHIHVDAGERTLRGRLPDAAAVRRFIEAGNATLTLVSIKTGGRFTYKFTRPEPEEGKNRPTWVKLLSGPDNTSDYSFMGTLWPLLNMKSAALRNPGCRSMLRAGRRWPWVLFHLYHRGGKPDQAIAQMEIWHEGRCGRCGRKLTVPQSIATGFGPECAGRMGI